jgi:hypothetical protein
MVLCIGAMHTPYSHAYFEPRAAESLVRAGVGARKTQEHTQHTQRRATQ